MTCKSLEAPWLILCTEFVKQNLGSVVVGMPRLRLGARIKACAVNLFTSAMLLMNE